METKEENTKERIFIREQLNKWIDRYRSYEKAEKWREEMVKKYPHIQCLNGDLNRYFYTTLARIKAVSNLTGEYSETQINEMIENICTVNMADLYDWLDIHSMDIESVYTIMKRLVNREKDIENLHQHIQELKQTIEAKDREITELVLEPDGVVSKKLGEIYTGIMRGDKGESMKQKNIESLENDI